MRRLGAGVGGVGEFLFEFTEGAGVFGFEAGELGGDAGLDVEFEVFGAGAVGLQVRLKSGLLAEYTVARKDIEREWGRSTSGLACRASTSSCEKRTGDSLRGGGQLWR